MANNQRREGLGKPSGDTLSSIDRLLAEFDQQEVQEGEFTVAMLQERNPKISASALRHRLAHKVQNKTLSVRKILHDKNFINVYRYVS
jgi:hypothetical protein